MKTKNQFFSFFVFSFFILLLACNQDNDCDGTVAIEAVIPNSNPPGTEIKIKGTGFTKPAVRFAGQLAKSELSAEKGLVAIVPNNVIGLVDLTVEDGECLVRTDFEVLGTLPNNWVAGTPTIIVLPNIPATFPPNISNQWKNYYDNAHTFQLTANSCNSSTAEQLLEFTTENHDTNKFLDGNPITGVYKCNSRVYVEIDRTKNGGIVEKLNGSIIRADEVGASNTDGNTYMLFTSLVTGRQYVFFTKI